MFQFKIDAKTIKIVPGLADFGAQARFHSFNSAFLCYSIRFPVALSILVLRKFRKQFP